MNVLRTVEVLGIAGDLLTVVLGSVNMLAIVKNVITIKVLGQGRAWEPGPPWCFLSHLTQDCHLSYFLFSC